MTPIIGREKEIDDLVDLLKRPDLGLITLYGFGGTGKTRLAIETGRTVLERFPDGVWFVALAPLSSPEHIVSATAAAIGFSFQSHDDQQGQLIRFLGDKKLLLIFDNLEHLLPAAASYLEALLQNATETRILVTSRQPINTPWEWVYQLHGLEYAANPSLPDQEVPAAAKLFLQHLSRAGAPESENDMVCAVRICEIVRGLPLALLLAASWGRALGCDEIFREIQRGLGFLNAWQKTFPEKHSSMQAVFDYSWQLLTEEEQAVLRKLAVFRGGFDRNAATEVAGATLALLASLIDQALLERVSNDRYQIHELLRQYLQEQLVERDEEKRTSDRHLEYYMHLAEQIETQSLGKQQKAWFDRLQMEIDNLRSALDWSLANGKRTDLEKGLQLLTFTERFWLHHTYTREAVTYLLQMLKQQPDRQDHGSFAHTYARGLNMAAKLCFAMEDLPATRRWAGEGLRIGLELNSPQLRGDAYYHLGVEAFHRGENLTTSSLLEHALEDYRKCDYLPGITQTLNVLGRDELFRGNFSTAFTHLSMALDLARQQEDKRNIYLTLRSLGELASIDPQLGIHLARAYFEEGLQYAREAKDKRVIGFLLSGMGEIARLEGDLEQAVALFEEVDSISIELGIRESRIVPLLNLGFVYLRLRNYDQSKQLFINSLTTAQRSEYMKAEMTLSLLGLAGVATAEGHSQEAATLLGAIEDHKQEFLMSLTDRNDYERILASVKAQLSEKQFNQLHKEGQVLSFKDAAQMVLNQEIGKKGLETGRIKNLTKRELEILRLVAQGLTDAQIAERLVLSPRTVNAHLTSVYSKLGVNSRAAATRFAMENGLA